MTNMRIGGWLFFRLLRWACWIGTIAYSIEFLMHKRAHLNSFGHLIPTTEFWLFAFPLGAVTAGFLELMMRERTGLPRPAFARNWWG